MQFVPPILPRGPTASYDASIGVERNQQQTSVAIPVDFEPLQSTDHARHVEQNEPAGYHQSDGSAQLEDSPATEIDLPWSPGGAEHRQAYLHTTRSLSPVYAPPQTPQATANDLPGFIKPLPSHLAADDIAYLEGKEAFALPPPALRDDCLRCYFQYMHPLYPAVEFDKIWSAIHAPYHSTGKISLLLIQTLIFAGGMWADVRLVRNAGFLSRKAFRQRLDKRIRVLYDADCEDDRLVLVQSLLLWSFWFRKPNDQKDGWYWVGIAHSIAYTIDLHLSASCGMDDRQHNRRLRKQVWWALCNREVIAAFDLRRAPRFTLSAEDVSAVSPDDFDYPEVASRTDSGTDRAFNASRSILTRLSVEYIKLTHIVGQILSISFHHSKSSRVSISHTPPWTGKESEIDDLVACNQKLTSWRTQVPDDLWHRASLPHDSSESQWSLATSSHRAMLSMMYNMALMTIHRLQAPSMETCYPSSQSSTNEREKTTCSPQSS